MNAATAAIAGLLFGLSLIVAIGAQNAFVLRQGALGPHIGSVIAICALSDAGLIAAGVGGMGALVDADRGLLDLIRWVGAGLLLAYALLAARRAHRGGAGRLSVGGADGAGGEDGAARAEGADGTVVAARAGSAAERGRPWRRVVLATLAFTWLNPGVYLDTVVLLGSVASAHPRWRWWFGLGAATGSVCWFMALGLTARLLAPVLRRPAAARLLEAFVALVMGVTALRILPL